VLRRGRGSWVVQPELEPGAVRRRAGRPSLSGNTEPLKPLLPYLPSARALRLHVVLTRPVAGASRAMFDVTLQTLRDTGGTTLVLSGERSEGQIVPQVYAEQMVPGRGRFVRRGEQPRIIQIANFEETEDAA
jgi:DNA segregation ATPase FtsK/SpoIIIE, S-DNA-T family